MQFFVELVIILAISGLFMPLCTAVSNSEFARRQRTRVFRPTKISPGAHLRSFVTNSVVSTGLLFAVTLPFQDRLFVTSSVGTWRAIYEAAAILLLYDFGYYLLHRFVLHEWSWGRKVHAVHHTVRTPFAKDSLYIHPIETALGMGLFLLCSVLLHPIGVSSFLLALLVYSLLNVFIHSAIDLQTFPFRTLTSLVRHHDIHHDSMKAGYYASITPLWDVIFRTTGEPLSHKPKSDALS